MGHMKLLGAFTLAGVLLAGDAYAQQVKSPAVGTVKSGTVYRSGVGGGVAISAAMIGVGNAFLITDVCVFNQSTSAATTTLRYGSPTTGTVIDLYTLPSQSRQCTHWDPGWLVPPNQDVGCQHNGPSGWGCAFTGIAVTP